jgi:hypothetical protein
MQLLVLLPAAAACLCQVNPWQRPAATAIAGAEKP